MRRVRARRPRHRSDLRPGDIETRRQRLAHARRHLEAFAAANRYQSELKGVAMAMIGYLEGRWRIPGWSAEFDRWWQILGRYAGVLASDQLTGPRALKRLKRVLSENQHRPSDLDERWLRGYGKTHRFAQNRPEHAPAGRV